MRIENKESIDIILKAWTEILKNTENGSKDRNQELLEIITEEIFASTEKIEKDYQESINVMKEALEEQTCIIRNFEVDKK